MHRHIPETTNVIGETLPNFSHRNGEVIQLTPTRGPTRHDSHHFLLSTDLGNRPSTLQDQPEERRPNHLIRSRRLRRKPVR